MYHFIVVSPITTILIVLLTVILLVIYGDSRRARKTSAVSGAGANAWENLPTAPGPKSYPIIGSMHLLGKYEVPYQAFGDLATIYGPIIRLNLGSVPSLVVNGQENIREVLMNKGAHFDSRPNFRRYHQLFSGDKENSLAFCNWSDVQKSRRDMLRAHTFPTSFSSRFQELDQIIMSELPAMMTQFESGRPTGDVDVVDIKPIILNTCGNIFLNYFCNKNFSSTDPEFRQMISNYDQVFYEVNQGYAADFLPFLLPLHASNFAKMAKWSHEIRNFIVTRVIGDRYEKYTDANSESLDYVDSLIEHVKTGKKPAMNWDTALFALEDIIGGHAAIGNLLVKILSFIVVNPEVQGKMQREIDQCLLNKKRDGYASATLQNNLTDIDIFRTEHEDFDAIDTAETGNLNQNNEFVYERTKSTPDTETHLSSSYINKAQVEIEGGHIQESISIKDRNTMPYTEAVILEGIRLIASPIVPHVANQDSSIAGFKVPKDTLIFLNNYELNMSDKLWEDPTAFRPERFIKNGRVQKPDYFLPFGGGKRSCMGYKMVQLVGFSVLANLLHHFTLTPVHNHTYKVPIGNLALSANQRFDFGVKRRT